MAVLSVLVATVVHRGAIKLGAALGASGVMLTVAVVAAAWLSVEAAAVATALELVVSNTSSADVALPALVGVHALIGIGEALITLGALGLIRAARPDCWRGRPGPAPPDAAPQSHVARRRARGRPARRHRARTDRLERPGRPRARRRGRGLQRRGAGLTVRAAAGLLDPGVDNEAASTILAGTIGTLSSPRSRWPPAGCCGSERAAVSGSARPAPDRPRPSERSGRARRGHPWPSYALVERYHARDSAVHRADARVKLLAALGYIFAITLTREGDWAALGLLTLPVGAAVVASRLPLALVLRPLAARGAVRARGAAAAVHATRRGTREPAAARLGDQRRGRGRGADDPREVVALRARRRRA